MGSYRDGTHRMKTEEYDIKVVSGSKDAVDNLIEYELKQYPQKDYGTVVLELDKTSHIKTVRIIRFKTKELCCGKILSFKQGVYPFDSGINL